MHDLAAPRFPGWRPPRWAVIAGIVAVLLVALLLTFDWNWLKSPIEWRVSRLTGREFVIHGDLDVDPGKVITVTASQLSSANVEWSSAAEMARVERASVDIALWPLLRGRWILPRVELDRPRLLLQRSAAGHANWRLGPVGRSDRSRTRVPYLGDLIVHAGAIELHDALRQTDLRLDVDSVPAGPNVSTPALVARGNGRHRDGKLELVARLDTPPGTLARGRSYRIDVRARAGYTRAHIAGRLQVPVDVRTFDLRAAISGQDLADLYPLLGIATPESPPYALVGQLSRNGDVVRYRDFRGTIGDSDVSGDLTVSLAGERPRASGNLFSKRLDFDDLAGLIGAPPSTKPGESASPAQKEEARRRAARQLVLPDRPYDLQKLRSMDADIRFRADAVDAGKLPIEAIAAQVTLENGVLRVKPLDLGVAGGRLTGSIRLDARSGRIATAADLQARGVELPELFPRTVPDSVGLIAADVKVEGHGNSVASMFATATGELGVVMGRGRFSNLLLELAGLDVAESLKFLLGEDRNVPLRCAYADFAIDDGIMKTESFAFDTTDTIVLGDGTLNLRTETIDFELDPRPKDFSPVSLRGPLEIGGTFKDPSFTPKPGPFAARTAAAAALFAMAPPAALLALIETGPGEDVDCGGGEPPNKEREPRPGPVAEPSTRRPRWKSPSGRARR